MRPKQLPDLKLFFKERQMLNICFSSNAAIMLKLAGKQNTVFLLDDLSVGFLKTQNYEHRFEEFYSIYGYRMEDRE